MSSVQVSSSSSKCEWDSQVYTGFGKVMCSCGELCVLRKAKTPQNYGKLFWGCKHFKAHTNSGCGFFEWFSDESRDGNVEKVKNLQCKVELQMKMWEEIQKQLHEAKSKVEVLEVKVMEVENSLKMANKMKKIWKYLFFMLVFVLFVKVL